MKKFVLVLTLLFSGLAGAAGGGIENDHIDIDLNDKAALQNGAKLFNNYCLGCHNMQYQRYERSFKDLGIPNELGQEYLQFTGEKVSDHIKSAIPAENAAKWFGAPPPDLTLVARVRGADWLYTYLRTFYVDESKTFGVNNKRFPDVGMPHVLQELQGTPRETHEERMIDGEMKEVYVGIKTDGNGELNAEEYDKAVGDLVHYLVYVGEPGRLNLEATGRWVLAFIVVLFIFVYLLKKEYWRDVH
ncbi:MULTISPECIES: cytochrome c1 [Alteromonadaceae]|uniref:cytochrome c1 n=1 Tax=Alteromonadaceae TaxID=72275 RepID=UPI001C089D97|nr:MULTISPECIES: cytochrome c1 [Aliiglaciecola]MBU2876625.1 cytochrome c1 [Aliiglaciecola lipolytica]MDO6711440.1 cytochrome c1 [Aliiglaciecola sp. 2_MG-2023]MDO6752583.1 cytochrome c1 [Aliiglaciecola sp. 1_MG-2023]